jgi:hypothetical protein
LRIEFSRLASVKDGLQVGAVARDEDDEAEESSHQ